MYLEKIKQLVVLQKVDDEIIILKEELESAPQELADLEAKVEALTTRREQGQEKMDMLSDQQKRLSGEIEEDSLKVKKSKNKLMMIGSTREYHAMMREMDSLEKLNRMREEEKVALVEEVENQEKVLRDIDEELSGMRAELDEKKAGLDKRIKAAQKRLDDLGKRRAVACEAVPKPILGRYEFIRERMENPVIVPVTEGVCVGCNIMIPPQIYNDLQKGTQIISCPNCQRLIFWREHVTAEKVESLEKEARA